MQQPDILLLDEPTNHLDSPASSGWKSCFKTRRSRASSSATTAIFSKTSPPHGRAEPHLSRRPALRRRGNYSTFLEEKAEFLHAQAKRQDALENRVTTEIEWLRRGPKARTTKSKARIDNANGLIGELADIKSPQPQ